MPKFPVPKRHRSPTANASGIHALIQAAENKPPEEAIPVLQKWLRSNPSNPQSAMVWIQLGGLFAKRIDYLGAADCFRKGVKGLPNLLMARWNLALCLERANLVDDAIEAWKQIIERIDLGKVEANDLTKALNHLSLLYESKGQWAEASAPLHRSFGLDPSQDSVLYHLVRMRQRLCEWPIYKSLPGVSDQRIFENTSALAMLAISDDPEQQLAAAVRNATRINDTHRPLRPTTPHNHPRIRIGYASSNFGMHPVSFLTASLFELHDRERFEVYGFCWSPGENTPIRRRVVEAFDHHIPLHHLSDAQAAELIRKHEVDVLIDLQGLTAGARPEIFAHRPALLQISYLGHPGTCCVPGVDHLIADSTIVPAELERHYQEKILHMPVCFQVNDLKRSVGGALSRADMGFPANATLLAAHNNNNKITPEMFQAWIEILRRTSDTVLWMVVTNTTAERNLRQEAEAANVPMNRIMITPHAGYERYLSSLAVSDLMLDTFPFNGGTTTSDALWMELPVLTLQGRSFASRMSSSLLNLHGIPELITTSIEDYVNKAVWLCSHLDELKQLKARLDRTATLALYRQQISDYEGLIEGVYKNCTKACVT